MSTVHTDLGAVVIAVNALAALTGLYTMFCALSNHEELGMSGTLVVG